MINEKLKLDNNNNIYYNCNKCYSYGMFISIILGGRGIGKTTTFKIKALNDAFKDKGEFIYLRRYKSETQKTKKLLNDLTDNVITKGLGDTAFMYIKKKQVLGYSIPLSIASTFKSTNFEKVTTIIYDEAIIKRGSNLRYLKDEVISLLEFVSTVSRLRKNVKLIILGNNLDLFNPYFAFFNIPPFKEIYVNKERGIYCELAKDSVELRKIEEETPLYKLINGTTYGDYHYNNNVLVESKEDIGCKDLGARLLYRLVFNTITLNIYVQNGLKLFIEFREKEIKDSSTFIILEKDKPNYLYIGMYKKSSYCAYLYKMYYDRKIIYENEKANQLISDFIELL